MFIDAAAFVTINKPKTLETFWLYCSEENSWKVQQQLGDLKQLDFVFDTNKTRSIKWQMRDGREMVLGYQ